LRALLLLLLPAITAALGNVHPLNTAAQYGFCFIFTQILSMPRMTTADGL